MQRCTRMEKTFMLTKTKIKVSKTKTTKKAYDNIIKNFLDYFMDMYVH